MSLSGAKGMLIHFNINPQVSLFAINNVMEKIHETIDSNAEVIFGTTTDPSLEKDEVKITIVATGFESKNQSVEENSENANSDTISTSSKITPESENYLDILPLMRNYEVQYRLK
jgi:cell division protein FtsZ